jgi:hypothetical protein
MSSMMEALVYWVATNEEEIHYLDAILSAYDGVASVRREYRLVDGETQYKIFVSPGMEDEFRELMERLRTTAKIGALVREEGCDAASAAR